MGDELDQHSKGSFEDWLLYLTDVKKSLRFWLERYTVQYCHEGKHVEIANAEILKRMGLITNTVSRLFMDFKQKEGKFKISEWLTEFHSGIQKSGMLHLNATELQQLAGGNELKDASRFTSEVMTGLTMLECTLKKDRKSVV